MVKQLWLFNIQNIICIAELPFGVEKSLELEIEESRQKSIILQNSCYHENFKKLIICSSQLR